MNRRAFTLIEVVVAITISAIVVTLAYAVFSASVEHQERVRQHQRNIDDDVTLRALILSALRHAERGTAGGPEVFRLTDSQLGGGDELTFSSRGVLEPYGTGTPWVVTLSARNDTLRFVAIAQDSSYAPIVGSLPDVRYLDVRALGRGRLTSWSAAWEQPSLAPQAVSIAYGETKSAPTKLVARIGLERTP